MISGQSFNESVVDENAFPEVGHRITSGSSVVRTDLEQDEGERLHDPRLPKRCSCCVPA